MIVAFDPEAFEDLQSWATQDKKIFKKIAELIKDITRTPHQREDQQHHEEQT